MTPFLKLFASAPMDRATKNVELLIISHKFNFNKIILYFTSYIKIIFLLKYQNNTLYQVTIFLIHPNTVKWKDKDDIICLHEVSIILSPSCSSWLYSPIFSTPSSFLTCQPFKRSMYTFSILTSPCRIRFTMRDYDMVKPTWFHRSMAPYRLFSWTNARF